MTPLEIYRAFAWPLVFSLDQAYVSPIVEEAFSGAIGRDRMNDVADALSLCLQGLRPEVGLLRDNLREMRSWMFNVKNYVHRIGRREFDPGLERELNERINAVLDALDAMLEICEVVPWYASDPFCRRQ